MKPKKLPKLNAVQRSLIRDWLRTPAGSWPESVQAYWRAFDECPVDTLPRDFAGQIPREDWHPSRQALS